MKFRVVYCLSLCMFLLLGCSSTTLPDVSVKAYGNVKSCRDTTLNHKTWEQKQKLAYIAKHTHTESFRDVVVDRYGNSYLLEVGEDGRKTRLAKYNCHGEKIWQKSMPKRDRLSIKAFAIQGNFLYMIGRGRMLDALKRGNGLLSSYRYIAKYNLSGKRLWFTKESKKNGIENANTFQVDVAVNSKGESYVIGRQSIKERSYIDKYSRTGRLLWHKTFADLEFYSITIDKKENLILTGSVGRDALIVKYTTEGKRLWKQIYSYDNNHKVPTFLSSVIDKKNNIYTTGDDDYLHAYVFKFDAQGHKQWEQKTLMASHGNEKGVSLLVGVDHRLYIAGYGLKIKKYKAKPLATSVYDLNGNVLVYRLNKDKDKQKKSDTLLSNDNFYKAYRRKNGRYYIVQKGKVIYDDLKYFNILKRDSNGTAIQIIESNNRAKKIFIKAHEPQHPMEYVPFMCGNGVITHHASIVDRDKAIDVEVVFYETDEAQYQKDVNKTHKVVRIAKNRVDRLFFKAFKKKMIFSENYDNPQPMLYYQKGMKYGFLGNIVVKRTKKRVEYSLKRSKDKKLYDALVFEEDLKIRLKYHDLLGYYNLTKIKYKSIGKFDKNLARFELPNGKKGYVDLKGVEYYD